MSEASAESELASAKAVCSDVLNERVRQFAKWGQQNHCLEIWALILGEEVGEVQKAILEFWTGKAPKHGIRSELIQVAAVAIATVEYLDRQQKDGEK